MRFRDLAVFAIFPTCLIAVPSAHSAELQPPVPLYSVGLPTASSPDATNPPGSVGTCPALPSPVGAVRPGRLVIRKADRPDVGPYTVTLPGYGTGAGIDDQQFYRPFLVTAAPGDALRFDIVNQLAGDPAIDATNLHTHGMVVQPRPCTPLGDYIFVEDQPGTTTSYRIDVPATLPGNMFRSQPTPAIYPSGFSWFHGHLHGQAEGELLAGQSGMLYIGNLLADLRAAPDLSPATAAALDNTDVLYMGLRDIQLAVPGGVTPDRAPPGQRAQWLNAEDYDPSACPNSANPPIAMPGQFAGPGYCGHHGATTGDATNPQQDTVWLFTVNGQSNPTVTMQPGRNQVWRIVNMSPDVTYGLQLTDDATGRAQTMTTLAIDGVVAGSNAPGSTDLHVGVPQPQILITPGGRAEVLVFNTGGAAGRRLTLRTVGLTTGAAGDHWPRIDLAHVVMPPGGADSAPPLDVALPMATPSVAAPASLAAAAPVPGGCVALPPGQVVRRRITFTENPDDETFMLGSEVVDAYGRVVDDRLTIPPQVFPMDAMIAPDSVPRVCPRLGEREVWEVVNASGEMHNFHIHQSKFRLTRPTDSGAPPNLIAFQDPSNLLGQYMAETQAMSGDATVDIWRDVVPLAPYGGRIFVTIPFYAPQQVGNFVYHCHILGHEDHGMMAVVQVYDPTGGASN